MNILERVAYPIVSICRCKRCHKLKNRLEMTNAWYGTGTCRECVDFLYLKVDAKLRKAFGKC